MTATTSSARPTALEQASTAIMQKMYEQSAAAGGASARAPRPGAAAGSSEQAKDDVLDAEFEEVKDSDRKKA